MRLAQLILLGLLAMAGLPVAQADRLPVPAERPAGAPGTPTPQPFVRPQPRHLPSPPPNTPPLLDSGRGQPGGRLSLPRDSLAPADGRLPLLEQQLQRNSRGLPGSGD